MSEAENSIEASNIEKVDRSAAMAALPVLYALMRSASIGKGEALAMAIIDGRGADAMRLYREARESLNVTEASDYEQASRRMMERHYGRTDGASNQQQESQSQ